MDGTTETATAPAETAYEQHIRRIVDSAPPLSDRQRSIIGPLFERTTHARGDAAQAG